jgi:uncharacterized membrane protein
MIRTIFLCLVLCAGSVASAQEFPATYQVTGVAADDVLNIRAEPAAGAAKVGEIGPYGFNIEVLRLSDDGAWGLVPMPEGSGWVAMRFLQATPAADPALVPRPLSCSGTEPFWTMGLFPKGAEWLTPEDPRADLTVKDEAVAPQGYRLRAEEGPTRVFHLTVTRQQCSDGMSDRAFGLAASLFIESPDGNDLRTGCCTLDHRD